MEAGKGYLNLPGVIELVLLEKIGRTGGMSGREEPLVPQQERGALLGGCQQFMGIPRHGIGPESMQPAK